jgi:GxxExxY protein
MTEILKRQDAKTPRGTVVDVLTPQDIAEDRLGKEIVDSAVTIHKTFGPGLLESVYEVSLAAELAHRRLQVQRQIPFPVTYRGEQIDLGFRIDLLVGNSVVVEIKAVERVAPVHAAQLMTYMRITGKRLGYLLNFNAPLMRDGIKRMVLRDGQK